MGLEHTLKLTSELFAERRRQVLKEDYADHRDDALDKGELARAAACYALATCGYLFAWPFMHYTFKPTSRRRNLVKAGALIIAEIERLDRAEEKLAQEQGGL